MTKYLTLLFSISLLFSAQADSKKTFYSELDRIFTKRFLKPIQPKIPGIVEQVKELKANQAKLNAKDKRKLEEYIKILKRYQYLTKACVIFRKSHEETLKLGLDEDGNNIKSKKNRPIYKKLQTLHSKRIALIKEYPEISMEEDIIAVYAEAKKVLPKKQY